ncbi:MAG TPA: glycoside hydrolase family 97 N-terminal domain-containing protein, partial [Polyangia bacterium]|nr:glycoside hydrolase family 97 N-terminal domain-containing protein [Polyangia bacterium]
MLRATTTFVLVLLTLALAPPLRAATYTLQSPANNLLLTIRHDPKAGTVSYDVRSKGTPILEKAAVGITTSVGDFTSGLAFVSQARRQLDESYKLPVGKRSSYLNHARELQLVFKKGEAELAVLFRAYDDGVAFRYQVRGTGPLEITSEATTFPLSGKNVKYWGQAHPNNFGYETPLGPVTADRISMPVLAELVDRKHFVFVAQAATYGDYILPNYKRSGNALALHFPMDQKEPVKTTLPFDSPWRVVMISPNNLGRIVESTLLENLNPPTEPELVDAPWIKPGRASWDFLAGDG